MKLKGQVDYPANVVVFPAPVTVVHFPDGAKIGKVSPVRSPKPGEDPIDFAASIIPVDRMAGSDHLDADIPNGVKLDIPASAGGPLLDGSGREVV